MTLPEIVDALRLAGVRSFSIELEPASAAAPELEVIEPQLDERSKLSSECSQPECHAPNGFHFAPRYCEQHGLQQFGVK